MTEEGGPKGWVAFPASLLHHPPPTGPHLFLGVLLPQAAPFLLALYHFPCCPRNEKITSHLTWMAGLCFKPCPACPKITAHASHTLSHLIQGPSPPPPSHHKDAQRFCLLPTPEPHGGYISVAPTQLYWQVRRRDVWPDLHPAMSLQGGEGGSEAAAWPRAWLACAGACANRALPSRFSFPFCISPSRAANTKPISPESWDCFPIAPMSLAPSRPSCGAATYAQAEA